jgi:uncharacterized NAD(P)/FAD-binding protein YdhS
MRDAVVVGAGFGGVLASRELLRGGWRVLLVDPGARAGRGLAYSTTDPWHLLNSPAGTMSVEPDDPDDFVAWCRRRDPGIGHADFVCRHWYGDYLAAALGKADALGDLTVHSGRVVRIFEGDRMVALLDNDVVIKADLVVLALGNAPPARPFAVDQQMRHFVDDPWKPGALQGLPPGPVTLIGSGLTAVDVALSLARSGRHGRITMVSRHGMLPRAHAPGKRVVIDRPKQRTVSGLLRAIRQLTGMVGDWRAVMDGLRPHWNDLWCGLSAADQERFLRHAARWWEVHRHRMAPGVAAEIERLRELGMLEICPGRVVVVEPGEQGVVNCTGPGSLVRTDPLIRSLIAEGLAQPGPHGLGIDVDRHGALIRPGGKPSRIYALGAARKGCLWETTAAPEIRAQARSLAVHLLSRREPPFVIVSQYG